MEITQEERLDLTDKQVREEYQAYTISAIENTLGILSTRQTIEDLKAENQRLKNELDKQIKDNRKLVKALKEYANMSNWFVCYLRHHFIFKKDNYKANELAKETLKEIEEE